MRSITTLNLPQHMTLSSSKRPGPEKTPALSPNGQLLAEVRDEVIAYLKANPKPIKTPELLRVLKTQAEKDGKPYSSFDYGAGPHTFVSRHEAYSAIFWSLRASGLIYTKYRTWEMCWHEHVPKNERDQWWMGMD